MLAAIAQTMWRQRLYSLGRPGSTARRARSAASSRRDSSSCLPSLDSHVPPSDAGAPIGACSSRIVGSFASDLSGSASSPPAASGLTDLSPSDPRVRLDMRSPPVFVSTDLIRTDEARRVRAIAPASQHSVEAHTPAAVVETTGRGTLRLAEDARELPNRRDVAKVTASLARCQPDVTQAAKTLGF